jgi:tetratricopeptide (TPR) repeat protein
MQSRFDLVITADPAGHTAELRLLDAHGSQLAYKRTDFKTIPLSRQQGLFDLRNYVRHYVEPGREAASVAEIGMCIAEEVLGEEIFRVLGKSRGERTLRIQLPGAAEEENQLAAALARVPWEIARPAADQPTLGERNLLVRVVHDMAAPVTEPLGLGEGEDLRVLFVFAEARESRPLAARLERRVLQRLFGQEVYPQRRVVADFLTHGVTRERLESQIADRGGYHVIHWSGHGHLNRLELARPGGAKDLLSGEDMLALFDRAGGFIPRLFFLSACHSGDILRVKDWSDFFAVAQGKEPGTKEAPFQDTKEIALDEQPGYTGTAHALLQGGVPSVVAMRYAVGDDYARELGVEFYRRLLADTQPKTAAAALTMARRSLLDPKKHRPDRYHVCDHATPVLYGEEQPGLTLRKGRSPALDTRSPRLHQVTELTTAGHEHFVGRTWELAGLGADFIGSSSGAEVRPVALVTGLGGMGKTALAAEALALWESRFDWVLLYQAKPNALGFDATLRDIHLKLYAELGRYHEHVKSRPADAIHRAADAEFTGPDRLERLTRNLVRALLDEPILLVLDNFDTNLKPHAEPDSGPGDPLWACQDPSWDRCLALLAEELVGTPSRVLITCRWPIAALADRPCHRVLLGPLRAGEAAQYLREHRGLSGIVFGGDAGEKALAMRLLSASRFHPLLMDRLARLATGGPDLRPQLMQALNALESSNDHSQLPELFATGPGDAKELAYLNDALAASLDQLIHDAGPDARRLLWMIAVANEPVALGLLKGVWSGESYQQQKLRKVKQMLDRLSEFPPELQAELNNMQPELRAQVEALPPEVASQPDPVPLLRHLVAVGLVTEEHTGPDNKNLDLTCHELVRERIGTWMRDRPDDRADLTENTIRLGYAKWLEEVFKVFQHQNMAAAIEAGSRALVYCVEAEAYDRLGGFSSSLVTSSKDPHLLASLLPHLEAAATSAPEGKLRWSCLTYLADALRGAGRSDSSLPLYEQAATLARTVAETKGEHEHEAWSDVAWITGNWAVALIMNGELDKARQLYLDSAEIYKRIGAPSIRLVARELEALRIDIMQGRPAEALPQVKARLGQVESWWQQHRSGHRVPEAPRSEELARVLISAHDIAADIHFAQLDWEAALQRIDAILKIERELERAVEDIAVTRMNRAIALGALNRFGEAKTELEACLQVFQSDPANRSIVLSSLADLLSRQGDVTQAIVQQRRALALREQLPDPDARAVSHHKLADYLGRSGIPADVTESARHELTALIYFLVSGFGQHLQVALYKYSGRFIRADAVGTPLAIPRVAELLADPAFRPLDDWLRQRQVDVAQVQAAVDDALEQARQQALAQPYA